MKHAALLCLICLPFTATPSLAQESGGPPKPATKLEAFQARTGVVIIRGFTTVGTIRGMGSVTVDAREFKDASTATPRSTGVSIEVKEPGRLERENRAFIDSDEIQSLLAGIDYIANASAAVTTLSKFEVEYRTKGDFSVTVFNDSSGKLSAAVSAGRIGKSSAYLSMEQLRELRELIVSARAKVAG